ncbi:MAG: hypothetical protein C7B44_15210 [Sulfobacillus thermosulfidooxidans]|uniref:Uncharacterized protein n=1 Tax=Sulfobacillus thermotolerans TaxID=338644 RepID=A0ABN5GYQ9_9FIRM|nr:hypothetical protein BXT84_06740 [Sulfobacillus thermotolerans]PSR32615.1 MAG: hypothetical protein C7B44_15210 [Sulfobacillus thermosulfidooxidans]
MNDKNILAFFSRMEDAQKCQTRLREEGFDVVEIDPIPAQSAYDTQNNMLSLDDGHGLFTTNLHSASSYLWSTQGIAPDAWLLTAVVPAEDRNNVADIVRHYGGQL